MKDRNEKMGHCITGLWILVCIVFTLSTIFSFTSPVWFENQEKISISSNKSMRTIVAFGMVRYCRKIDLDDPVVRCRFYEGMTSIPSITWMICAIVYSVGAGLIVLSIFCMMFGCCLTSESWGRLKLGLAYLQLFGVVFLSLALLFYPLGLDCGFARRVCGPTANMYVTADCQIAWGYVLAIMSTALLVFCPILAKYSIDKSYDNRTKDNFHSQRCVTSL